MADHQNVVDNIEYVLADLDKLRGFVTTVKTFLSTPQSKKTIRAFCEECLLDRVFTAGELNPLYTRLTLDTTDINTDLLHRAVCGVNNPLVNQLKTAIKKKISITYESGACAVQNDYFEANKETEEGKAHCERLLLALGKINALFATARQLPIEPDQFVQLSVPSEKQPDISRSIEENVKDMMVCANAHLDNLFSGQFLTLLSDNVEHLDPFLCKNNYLSLRNFVIYLKTL